MKTLIQLFALFFLVSCNLPDGVNSQNKQKNYDDLSSFAISFDGNGIGWESVEGASSYTILKDGEKWKSENSDLFVITIGEKGEFRIIANDEKGQPTSASKIIQINMTARR